MAVKRNNGYVSIGDFLMDSNWIVLECDHVNENFEDVFVRCNWSHSLLEGRFYNRH